MEAEWLEEFGAVFCVVVVIRFARRPIRVVHIVLCRLPNKPSFLYSVREPNPVIFCIYRNKIALYIVYLTMLRFVLVFYTLLHFMCTDTCEITVLLKHFLVKCNAQIAKNELFMTAIMEF